MNLDLMEFLVKLLKCPQPVSTSWRLFFSISRKKKKKKRLSFLHSLMLLLPFSTCYCRSLQSYCYSVRHLFITSLSFSFSFSFSLSAIRWDTYCFVFSSHDNSAMKSGIYCHLYCYFFLSLCGSLWILAVSLISFCFFFFFLLFLFLPPTPVAHDFSSLFLSSRQYGVSNSCFFACYGLL